MFKIFKKIDDDSYEFKPVIIEIEDRPLNPLGRTVLWIIITLIIACILWLFFAKVDVVVSARGKVIPTGEIKILKPLETGVVSKIFVKEGQVVKAGEILMQIDPSVSMVNLKTKQDELDAINMSIKRLETLGFGKKLSDEELNNLSQDEKKLYLHQLNTYEDTIKQYEFKLAQAKHSANGIDSEIQRLSLLLKKSSDRLDRLQNVKDIIAYKDYENTQKEVFDTTEKLNIAKQQKLESAKKIGEIKQEMSVFKENIKTKYLDELINKQKEASDIKAQINTYMFQGKQQQITSPVDGYIGKLMINTQGGIVNSTEPLLSVIPANEPLIIKANVLNKDIGFLSVGQEVAIKIDTFNFQKYGKLDGKLFYISNDSLKDEKLGEIYEIKVEPKQTTLLVDGEEKSIEPGMSVSAEIKTGKRRVIELFVYPIIKYLDEGLSVR
ncbi:putative membrane-fusion protein [Campylobacter sputorum subsp. bubulus]|uniref:Putative membrane-fusion protein n=1 Tax=Campylobacter sputorum subsp. sputorum TaxID=32024 RepID=A0A381DKY3_9BACT|nr:HlyD family type I secretion periplasmic adaptor subunit [Campylobacter sputorum]ASM34628.1 type I secretion system, membrane fusion protein, HlyD family [Campylobacter sputorum aubsp. sputorum RM3237]KAB0581157.1 HlyD family type I secretion periplasmic adaptor subunit [Campylobacter sputorum subsp. sputorum]QEL04819.1 type I secretion system membrane fusion protein, HlyD family [Campylobacter sputorum subsp. sputorum]SUX09808.1 putative membrane-fusion protein [Campylobacter sputorum subsp